MKSSTIDLTDIEPVIKLSEIEKILREQKLVTPSPCRETLIHYCQNGIFEAKLTEKGFYVVTIKSFKNWLISLQPVSK